MTMFYKKKCYYVMIGITIRVIEKSFYIRLATVMTTKNYKNVKIQVNFI